MEKRYKLKNDNLNLKIERVIEFVKQYPLYWGAGNGISFAIEKIEDEEERKRISKLFSKIHLDYRYIKERLCKNALNEFQIARLVEGEIGRNCVPLSDKVKKDRERIISEYGISEEIADQLVYRYGSIENFKKAYIEALKLGKVKEFIPSQLLSSMELISGFDTKSKDFVFRDFGKLRFLKDVFSDDLPIDENSIFYVDGEKISKACDEIFQMLSQRNAKIISKIYGFKTGKRRTRVDVAKEERVSPQRITQIILETIEGLKLKKIKVPNIVPNFELKEFFPDEFFRQHGIFLKSTKNENISWRSSLIISVINSYISSIPELNRALNSKSLNTNETESETNELKMAVTKIDSTIGLLADRNKMVKRELYKKFLGETRFLGLIIEYGDSIEGRNQNEDYARLFGRMILINKTYTTEEKASLIDMLKEKREILSDNNLDFYLEKIRNKSKIIQEIRELKCKDSDLEMLKIENLNLPNSTYGALKRKGINSIIDWLNLSEEEKNSNKGIGGKGIRKINEAVEILEKKNPDIFKIVQLYNASKISLAELDKVEAVIKNKYFVKEAREHLNERLDERRDYIRGFIHKISPPENQYVLEDVRDSMNSEEFEINEDLREKIAELKKQYKEKELLIKSKKFKKGKFKTTIRLNRKLIERYLSETEEEHI